MQDLALLYFILVPKVSKFKRFGAIIQYNSAKYGKIIEIWHHYILKPRFKYFTLS